MRNKHVLSTTTAPASTASGANSRLAYRRQKIIDVDILKRIGLQHLDRQLPALKRQRRDRFL